MEHYDECPACGEDLAPCVEDDEQEEQHIAPRFHLARVALATVNAGSRILSAICEDLIEVLYDHAIQKSNPSPVIIETSQEDVPEDRVGGGITAYDA